MVQVLEEQQLQNAVVPCKSLCTHPSVPVTQLCVRGKTGNVRFAHTDLEPQRQEMPGWLTLTWSHSSSQLRQQWLQQSWDPVESSAWPLEPPNPAGQGCSGTRKHAIRTAVGMEPSAWKIKYV